MIARTFTRTAASIPRWALWVLPFAVAGCREGYIAGSIGLGLLALLAVVFCFAAFSEDAPGAGILSLILALAASGGAYWVWPASPAPSAIPAPPALPPTPVAVARHTMAELQNKRLNRVLPALNQWRGEQAEVRAQASALRAALPPEITSYAGLLARRDEFLPAINAFERLATLTHGIRLLEHRLADYDRAIAELDQTIWQADHMEALTRATDSPEMVERLRASIQVGQRLTQENIEPTTRADLGRLAEDAFGQTRVAPEVPARSPEPPSHRRH